MERRHYPLERLFGRILSPFEEFLRRTTAGGIVLVATTAATLVLAAALGAEPLRHFWEQRFAFGVPGRFAVDLSLHQWINDGLMALFFLLVGLELKREVAVGELSSLRDAALPVIAAAGGMVVPAAIYVAFNPGGAGAHGWGIPMATDIAFAVGILVLLAWRVPRNLIIFLTALAIADDLGAVLVIALFYTAQIDWVALGVAAFLAALLLLLNRAGIRNRLPYVLAGLALWYFMHASGIHATLAGIVLALAIPARPARTPAEFDGRILELHEAFRDERAADTPDDPLSNPRMASIAAATEHSAMLVRSPLERLEHDLSPWVTFLVIPVFAFSNAAIDLGAVAWGEVLGNRVTLGVLAGLFLGKFAGIAGFSYAAVRLGLGRLPAGVEWRHMLGAAWLGGIGFTMSLFIAQLAFADPAAVEQAKIGILLASALSAAFGLVWLFVSARERTAGAP